MLILILFVFFANSHTLENVDEKTTDQFSLSFLTVGRSECFGGFIIGTIRHYVFLGGY